MEWVLDLAIAVVVCAALAAFLSRMCDEEMQDVDG